MKSHTTRPVAEELKELYEIAAREHGPQGRSTRAIKRSLETLGDKDANPAPRARDETPGATRTARTGRQRLA